MSAMERKTTSMASLKTISRSSMEETRKARDVRRYWPLTTVGRQRVGLFLLLTLCLAVRVLSMPDQIYTYDEGQHLWYGHQILKLNSDRLEGGLWVSKILGDGW